MPNVNSESDRAQKGRAPFEKIAHRGASAEAPENTIPAFELAFNRYGCDRVEMDIRLTRDGVPVIFHDQMLEGTTNGTGCVRALSVREIKALDAGFRFDPQGNGGFPFRGKDVTIPTLEEVITTFPDRGFFIEIKDRGREVAERVLEVISRTGCRPGWVVGSFHGPTMREFRSRAGSSIETFLAEDEVIFAQAAFRLGFKKVRLPGRFASLPRAKYGFSLDTAAWIEFLHRHGVRVYYWTVNEKEEMKELASRGADGIITDWPDRLVNLSGIDPTGV